MKTCNQTDVAFVRRLFIYKGDNNVHYIAEGVNLFVRDDTLYFNNDEKLFRKKRLTAVEEISEETYITAKFGEAWMSALELIEKHQENWLDVPAVLLNETLLITLPCPTSIIYHFNRKGVLINTHHLTEAISAFDLDHVSHELITLSDDGSLIRKYVYRDGQLVLYEEQQLKTQYTQMCCSDKGILLVDTSEQKTICFENGEEQDWLNFPTKIFDVVHMSATEYICLMMDGIYLLDIEKTNL